MRLRIQIVCLLVSLHLLAPDVSHPGVVQIKDGPKIEGEIELKGDIILIKTGKNEFRFPLNKVISISTSEEAKYNDGLEYLVKGLELRLKGKSLADIRYALKSAYAADPENPDIQYWYLLSLLDGLELDQAAEIFKKHDDELREDPERYLQIMNQMENYRKYAEMPWDLAREVLRLNETIGNQVGDYVMCYGVLQIVDENNNPVDRKTLDVRSSGADRKEISFDDGYILYQARSQHRKKDAEGTLNSYDPALNLSQSTFRIDSKEVYVNTTVVQKKQKLESRKQYSAKILDENKNPVEEATIRISSGSSWSRNFTTNHLGVISTELYPADYFIRSSKNEYKPLSTKFTIEEDQPASSTMLYTMETVAGDGLAAKVQCVINMDGSLDMESQNFLKSEVNFPINMSGVDQTQLAKQMINRLIVIQDNKLMFKINYSHPRGEWLTDLGEKEYDAYKKIDPDLFVSHEGRPENNEQRMIEIKSGHLYVGRVKLLHYNNNQPMPTVKFKVTIDETKKKVKAGSAPPTVIRNPSPKINLRNF